jgi:alpha-glucosidase (family GH31 glycosyl hydrolase)
MKHVGLCAVTLLMVAGCEVRGPFTHSIAAPGIRVVVKTEPFGFDVFDGDDQPVLVSRGHGAGDGYGGLGYATGSVRYNQILSPGYQQVDLLLDEWRDVWVVEHAESQRATDLLLGLRERGGGRRVEVVMTVREGTLRVEARASGEAARMWSSAFYAGKEERFVGFGERFNRVDQRGVTVYNWAEEGGIGTGEGTEPNPGNPSPNGEAMTYYPVPFFVSTAGYGFWLDSTWRSEFDLVTDHDGAWRVRDFGPRLAYEIYVGPPLVAIDRFTARTGRPMVPPAWTFGPRRRVGRNSMQMGKPEIEAMRDLDLAITAVDDALHFLPGGSDFGIEPQLAAWTAEARRLGYRVNGYYNAYFGKNQRPEIQAQIDEGLAKKYFLLDGQGNPTFGWILTGGQVVDFYTVDFTSAEASRWYTNMFERAHALGYSGWMYDFGEYVLPEVVTASGMSGEEYHNLFPVTYQKAAFDALEAGPRKGDWLTFVRSGFTGASQYAPMVWSGDPAASFESSDGLPSMVRAGVNLGASGAPHWGGDIGGFHCTANGFAAADGELWTRWIQMGAMSSNMMDQNACVGARDMGPKKSIWTEPDAMAAWKTYARLHTRLLPYFQALAAEAHATGAPVMRQPWLEHPDQPELARLDDQYYLGPAIYVAPVVVRGAREKKVVFGKGRFLDWRDPAVHGAGEVTVPAPLAKLPLYLRDGYLVPLLDATIDTLAEESLPEVISLKDVETLRDVVGFVHRDTGKARFAGHDGAVYEVTWNGTLDTAGCGGCTVEELGGGLRRLRVELLNGTVTLGGLTLTTQAQPPVVLTRWELYLQ